MTAGPQHGSSLLKTYLILVTHSVCIVPCNMSVLDKVLQHLESLELGVPFYIDELYALASIGSVQKTIGKLARAGKVIRVGRGMYAAPKPLPSVPNIVITTSPEEIAKLWAKKHGYRLASQGVEAAYKIGFQTQAPVRTVYWSDGPTREFTFGNATLFIRRVSSKRLKFAGQAPGILLRAIYATNADAIEMKDLQTAFNRLSITNTEMAKVLKQLQEEPVPKKWIIKLKSFGKLSIPGLDD